MNCKSKKAQTLKIRNKFSKRSNARTLLFIFLLGSALVLTSANFVQTVSAAYYRDYKTFIDAFKSLANSYPSLVSYNIVGKTVLGNEIIMFKIGNPNGGKVLVDGAIHGTEALGSELLYYYARWLLKSSDSLAKRILSGTCTLLIPSLNIDKYNIARKNANGVDLNRNFATNWESGDSNPRSDSYRGPAPLSEPESQTLTRVFQTYKPKFYVNLHMWDDPYYAGSYYANSTYYSSLKNKIDSLSKERGVTPLRYAGQFRGTGYAISDAAHAGITSFLIELSETYISYTQIETTLLPRFIPIAGVLSQECGTITTFENATTFEDGFESGNFNAWSGLTVTSGSNAVVSGLNPYEGSYCAKFETGAVSSGTARACTQKSISGGLTVYARCYFYVDSGLPLDDNDDRFTLIQFLNSKNSIIGNLQVRHVQGEDRFAILAFNKLITTTAVYPKPKTWYCLELCIKLHSTQGAFKAYINGREYLSYTDLDTTSLGSINIIRFGLASSINTQKQITVYCDYAAIATNYIGP